MYSTNIHISYNYYIKGKREAKSYMANKKIIFLSRKTGNNVLRCA